MSVTVPGSGTISSSVSTSENEIYSVSAQGVYQLVVDLNALAAQDWLEIRVNGIVLASGTKRLLDGPEVFAGVQQVNKIWRSEVYSNDLIDTDSLEFTYLHRFGTSRSLPWKVLKHA